MSFLEATLQKVERRESKYEREVKAARAQYQELRKQINGMDASALDAARQSIRPDMEREAYRQMREVYGKRYDSGLMKQSRKDVAAMLGEQEQQTSIRQQIRENYAKANSYEQREPTR